MDDDSDSDTGNSSCGGRSDFSLYDEHDAFNVGPDGLMHFTDTHLHVGDLEDFCVEQSYTGEHDKGEGEEEEGR